MTPFIVVVGAGLAAGYHLNRAAVPFRILEAEDRADNSRRNRHASVTHAMKG